MDQALRRNTIQFLRDVGSDLDKQFGENISGFYLYGSLAKDNGDSFNPEQSDVDVILTTPLHTARKRVEFIEALMVSKLQVLENELQSYLGRREQPITSLSIATDFEVREGIHMERNSPFAFSLDIFLRLTPSKDGSDNNSNVLKFIGDPLKSDMVMQYYTAWTILAEAQRYRSNCVAFTPDGKFENKVDEHSKEKNSTLPKDLLRGAYLYSCLAFIKEPMKDVKDDIVEGLDALIELMGKAAKEDDKAGSLFRSIKRKLLNRSDNRLLSRLELLYLWELLAVETEQAVMKRRIDLDKYKLDFAADAVIRELLDFRATTLEAVDKAVILYRSATLLQGQLLLLNVISAKTIDLKNIDLKTIDLKKIALESIDLCKAVEINKDANIEALIDEWPDDISKYLRTQLREGCTDSKCKVGFVSFEYTQAPSSSSNGNTNFRLTVCPLTYWITEQFNQNMVLHLSENSSNSQNPFNAQLRGLREQYGRKLFENFTKYPKSFGPSSLYLEMVVVTSDDFIPELFKIPRNSSSSIGNGSPVSTCGFEYGFLWNKHVQENRDNNSYQLNIHAALLEGLKAKLFLDPPDVKTWDVMALAIQHTHLDAALIGIVYINKTRDGLREHLDKHIKDNAYYGLHNFFQVSDALLKVIDQKNSRRWHQTALLRLKILHDSLN